MTVQEELDAYRSATVDYLMYLDLPQTAGTATLKEICLKRLRELAFNVPEPPRRKFSSKNPEGF